MLDLHFCSLALKFVEWTHLAPAPSKQWGKHFLTWNSLGIADPQHNYCFSNNHGSVENTCIWKVTPMIGGTHDCWILMIQVSLPFLPSIMVQWKITHYMQGNLLLEGPPFLTSMLLAGKVIKLSVCCSVVRPSWPLRYFLMRERTIGHSLLRCLKSWQQKTKKKIEAFELHYSHYKVDPNPSCKLRL